MRALSLRLSPLAVALACGVDAGTPEAARPRVEAPPDTAPAALLTVERLDDAASCDGLVPAAVPVAIEARAAVPAGAACLGGTADGAGQVAIAWAGAGSGAAGVSGFAADGAATGTFSAEGLSFPVPQPRGFHAVAGGGAGSASYVALVPTPATARVEAIAGGELTSVAGRVAPDPSGGALVLRRGTHVAGNHWFDLAAGRRDAAGGEVAAPARVATGADPGGPVFFAGAVSTGGDALAVWGEGGQVRSAWLGASGAPAGDPADEGGAAAIGADLGTEVEAAALADGTVALRVDGAWRRAWAPGAAPGGAVPAWLAERPGTRVRLAAGGRANVLVPDGAAAGPCTQRVELRDAEGRLCGAVTLPAGEGATCATGRVELGLDGTLVQHVPAAEACTVRFWPALLR